MNDSKKIELIKLQLSKLDNGNFEFRQWYTNTTNIFKKLFEDSDDKIAQVRACMNSPAYMFSGIDVAKLKEDWRNLLTDYIEEIELFAEMEEEPVEEFNDEFVHNGRLAEIGKLESKDFDFVKLYQLCKEIDSNYRNNNFLSVVMNGRAIIDHVSPIFGFDNFNQVANNYAGGGKSFKKNIKRLNTTMRNLADMYLHSPIRKKEALPNDVQVNFKSELDLLLSEIIRIVNENN